MNPSNPDREWTQEELREHVAKLGVSFVDGEVIPQCVKWVSPARPTEEELEWAKFVVAAHNLGQLCRFCGQHYPPFDSAGNCRVCVAGMERANGD